jgi:hypothetical protein
VPRGAAYRERWEEAARQFVAEVRRRSPRTRIVLHAAQNATAFRTAQGDIVPLASADQFARMNKRWQRLNASFAGLADATIDVFHDEVVSFEEHPWGRFAVHYELSYHAAFLSKLTALALDDARTAAEQARATWPCLGLPRQHPRMEASAAIEQVPRHKARGPGRFRRSSSTSRATG